MDISPNMIVLYREFPYELKMERQPFVLFSEKLRSLFKHIIINTTTTFISVNRHGLYTITYNLLLVVDFNNSFNGSNDSF